MTNLQQQVLSIVIIATLKILMQLLGKSKRFRYLRKVVSKELNSNTVTKVINK